MNIAILGFGTVGSGVYDIINNSLTPFKVVKVFDKRDNLKEKLNDLLTNDINDILNDESIDTVVEALGGDKIPYEYTKMFLSKGINVVTSNKEVVASHIEELLELSKINNAIYLFEASCGGGIPNLMELSRVSKYDKIISIKGILNGTTNYILSKMKEEKLSFSECLKMAQEKGYSELDPTNDIEGFDILRKSLILYYLSFKKEFDYNKANLKPLDEKTLNEQFKDNKTIKYIASINIDSITIEPTIIDENCIFASVNESNNIIEINTLYNETLSFIGKGAGKYPTASAIIKDLYEVYNSNDYLSYLKEGK